MEFCAGNSSARCWLRGELPWCVGCAEMPVARENSMPGQPARRSRRLPVAIVLSLPDRDLGDPGALPCWLRPRQRLSRLIPKRAHACPSCLYSGRSGVDLALRNERARRRLSGASPGRSRDTALLASSKAAGRSAASDRRTSTIPRDFIRPVNGTRAQNALAGPAVCQPFKSSARSHPDPNIASISTSSSPSAAYTSLPPFETKCFS